MLGMTEALRMALHHHRALEPVAATDGRNLEMQRRVPRVTALVHEHLRRFVLAANVDQLLRTRMRLTEMDAEPALPVLNLLHVSPP